MVDLERLFEESDKSGGRQGILPFEYEEDGAAANVTSWAGLPPVLEFMRALGVDGSVDSRVRTRDVSLPYAFSDREIVEGAVLMLCAGGEHCDDMLVVGSDDVLSEMSGIRFASPAVLKQFLYRFHDDAKDEDVAKRKEVEPSYVPDEGGSLNGLHLVNSDFIGEVQRRSVQRVATLDLDASIIESDKREAAWTYKGVKGYQPTVVVWAEQDLIVADEFRDGNVPARSGVLRVLERAVASLPDGVDEINFRSDSAAYQHSVMDWCNAEIDGRPPVTFAISAEMSVQFKAAILEVSEDEWNVDPDDSGFEWADVAYVPSEPYEKKQSKPNRYLAIRVTPRQREFFYDGSDVKYFGVVTNDWKGDGLKIIKWHRAKAGTIEHVHHVLKNELGAGVLPSSRFGANAAWLRLNVLCYNILSAFKRLVLPKQFHKARPKRLRFVLFNIAGQIIHHARKIIVRLADRLRLCPPLTLPKLRRRIFCLSKL